MLANKKQKNWRGDEVELSEKALQVKASSTLSITATAKKMKEDGIDVVMFTAGEPDFNTPSHINQAAISAIHEGFTKYTDSSGTAELRKAVCSKLKEDNNLTYEPSQIVVSNGAKHALVNTFTAILNEGDEVLIPSPYWLSYPEMVHIAGGRAVSVTTCAENNYKASADDFKKKLTNKTKAIVLNSPNNPTGMVYTREELESIADFAVQNNLYVVSDEIYEKLVYGNIQHISIASLNDEIYKRTIVINGFSKGYAMTGWRLGYSAASKEISAVMGSVQSHMTSNPCSITQKAGLAALTGSQESVEEMRVSFEKRRDYIYERAVKIPLIKTIKPEGAFYLFIDVSGLYGKTKGGKEIKSAADVADVLVKEYNTVVIPCADFGSPDHIRLSYAISQENIEKGMDRIEEFVKENF